MTGVNLCFLSEFRFLLQERLKALKKGHGKKELGTVTLDMAIGGMRGIPVSIALHEKLYESNIIGKDAILLSTF